MAWPVIRLLMAAVFAWSASLLTPLAAAPSSPSGSPSPCSTPPAGRSARRCWDASTGSSAGSWSATRRPRNDSRPIAPLRKYASVVCTVAPFEDRSNPADRVAALEIVDRYRADRVVIGSQHADDESLLDLVRAFKSIGVPVSLLPRPLDLLEAPSATPSRVGGVPLIEVEALAARDATPYAGPDRRSTARPRSASSCRR